MVKAAKFAYENYPTVVNEIAESGMSYSNTMEDYALMDSKMQSAQKAIGGSSDSAQLSQSYMWSKVAKNEYDDEYWQLYHNTVILAVLAQVAIDGCKKVFEVDVNDDIKRIRLQSCMNKEKDYPSFMKFTRQVPLTKNGNERSREDIEKDKIKLQNRINPDIVCPMNWLLDCLSKIQGAPKTPSNDTKEYFISIPGRGVNSRQISKIRKLVESYDGYTKRFMAMLKEYGSDKDNTYSLLLVKTQEILSEIKKMKLSKITTNRLISAVLGFDKGVRNDRKYNDISKCFSKILNILYKNDPQLFLSFFIKGG